MAAAAPSAAAAAAVVVAVLVVHVVPVHVSKAEGCYTLHGASAWCSSLI